jgi:hypothetical protein
MTTYRINIQPDKLNISELAKAFQENIIDCVKDTIIIDGCSSQKEFYEFTHYISHDWAKRALQFQIGRSDKGTVFYGGAE